MLKMMEGKEKEPGSSTTNHSSHGTRPGAGWQGWGGGGHSLTGSHSADPGWEVAGPTCHFHPATDPGPPLQGDG